jgi:site-specific DNA-methyltransferase (adenine-specific)
MTIDLRYGDTIEQMKLIPDKSINLICADLPFGITANKWDSLIPLDELWEQYQRILAPKGNILLFGVGMFAFKLAMSNEKLFRYEMVWAKSKCGSPLTAKYMPLKKHELILVFGKSAANYTPQMVEGTPYKRNSKKGVNNMEYGAKDNYLYGSVDGKRHPNTILNFTQKWRRQDQLHPTQKPVELLEWIVNGYSNENDIVLDNTFGSCTTGIACINTNRNFIGIENNMDYFNISLNRVEEKRKEKDFTVVTSFGDEM